MATSKINRDNLHWIYIGEANASTGLQFPADEANEILAVATSEASYGWSTVSVSAPVTSGYEYRCAKFNALTLVLYINSTTGDLSVTSAASANVNKWKAYYR